MGRISGICSASASVPRFLFIFFTSLRAAAKPTPITLRRVGAQYRCIKKMWWERRDWVTRSSVLRPEWNYKELMIRTPAESPVIFYAYCLFAGWDLTEAMNEEHAHISGIVTISQKCLILKKKKIKWRWGIFSQFSVLIIRIDLSC